MRNFIDITNSRQHLNESGGRTLGSFIQVKVGDPNADFWMVRRGDESSVGKPSKTFLEHGYGITVTSLDILDPTYLYHLMVHIHGTGYFAKLATGSTNLVNIRETDITKIPVG